MENKPNGYLNKLKNIVPTWILIHIGTVVGLLVFRWLFAIQFSLLDLKEEIWHFWIPLILPWLPITIWLRPRIRVLTFKKEADNRRFFFQMISWGSVAVTSIIAQTYLSSVCGKLEYLNRIEEIGVKVPARYYKVKHFLVNAKFGCSYADVRTSGKYDERLNIDVFFIAPMVSDTNVRFTDLPKAWYGVTYHEQISNKISAEEKEKKYQNFIKECLDKINRYTYPMPDHFESLPSSDDKENFRKAIQERTHTAPPADLAILMPVNEPYEARNGNKLLWIFLTPAIGLCLMFFFLIFPGFSETELRKLKTGRNPKQDDLVDMAKFLIPSGDHFVTSIIVDLNILVFLSMIFSGIPILSPNAQELMEWGANRRNEVLSGQNWRLITNIFVHGGLMHLAVNICGLVIGALFIEPRLGRIKYLILYLLSGIIASISSMLWHEHTASVGASGAIFGVYGAILSLLVTDAFKKRDKRGVLMFIGVYVVINLIWGLTGGIDNAAHIGGLVSGAIIGLLLYRKK